jgi:mono/diheme cytochrome c family protein
VSRAKEKRSLLHPACRIVRDLVSRCGLISISLALLTLCATAHSQTLAERLGARSGREIYLAGCAACHGPSGNGAPSSETVFDRPDTFPHFAECDETAPESTRDWTAIVRKGGGARGFSRVMPSFEGVLSPSEISKVVAYLRSLCSEPGWPRGELNVPRALVTEKAFPESETVLATTIAAQGGSAVTNELDYERILGKRDQLEVAVPFGWLRQDHDTTVGGLGDAAVGIKHVVFFDTTSIFSVQAELTLPTGDARKGLGTGETGAGLFLAYDALLPAQSFVQIQTGTDLPFSTRNGPRSAFFRAAFGRSFNAPDLGRMWSPMLEVVGNRDLTSGARTDWDLVPEFQVTLNRRQHIRLGLGYSLPVNDKGARPRQVLAYWLWDWFDGGLMEGWK